MPTKRRDGIYPVHRLNLGLMLIFALLFISHSSALAHKVYIYAWLEGDTVYTESYFGAKKKVKQGLVRVFDLTGKKLLEGRTDEQGQFVFKPPSLIDLRLEVEAGMGHKRLIRAGSSRGGENQDDCGTGAGFPSKACHERIGRDPEGKRTGINRNYRRYRIHFGYYGIDPVF